MGKCCTFFNWQLPPRIISDGRLVAKLVHVTYTVSCRSYDWYENWAASSMVFQGCSKSRIKKKPSWKIVWKMPKKNDFSVLCCPIIGLIRLSWPQNIVLTRKDFFAQWWAEHDFLKHTVKLSSKHHFFSENDVQQQWISKKLIVKWYHLASAS